MARKTEVHGWRVSPALKVGLEEAARAEARTVSQLLEDIVSEHIRSAGRRGRDDVEQQRRLHERAARFAGCIAGRDRRRAQRARELVRARLRGRSPRPYSYLSASIGS